MNKFQWGDKVETPFGIGEIIIFSYFLGNDKSYKVRLNYKMDDTHAYEHGKPPVLNFTEKEIKPYKTAHDKLLELGWEMKLSDDIYYEKFNEKSRRNMIIRIPKDSEGYYVDIINNVIDLELSKILTQYLEELELENEK